MSKPEVGSVAPDFTAVVVGGGYGAGDSVTLSELRGKPVVLYFYPKDATPGCTTQACGLRDVWGDIAAKAHVFGISTDPVKSHEKFIQKFELPFPLIADENRAIAEAYGVWVEKSMYGKRYMGMERSTFLIGVDGLVAAVWEKVKPEDHASLLLKAL
ncbi:thioredoxin-dependent thiol peroxidase [Phragmitibacter flavus]|uniref:thioredoxin-dependent peroxiredoxin n=1 Tax=Phragmitibacter flavus TaxID=2576071 RepID=A0A5R8KH40_9BACT|nr:thioredoxin-dependent thiol peroxidase [Phragmitibacter flavus]TLD71577.1 thioredoxin-dependent thiol peroxidase [Phragmitibacter flavus]